MTSQGKPSTGASSAHTGILPADTVAAVQKLCRLTQTLIDIADRESQALIRNDSLAFAILQDEKNTQTTLYASASGEFRARLEEFRALPHGLLKRLEDLQRLLGERCRDNNIMVGALRKKAVRSSEPQILNAGHENGDRRVRFDGAAALPATA